MKIFKIKITVVNIHKRDKETKKHDIFNIKTETLLIY